MEIFGLSPAESYSVLATTVFGIVALGLCALTWAVAARLDDLQDRVDTREVLAKAHAELMNERSTDDGMILGTTREPKYGSANIANVQKFARKPSNV